MAKIPIIFRKTGTVETLSVQEDLSAADFPAGRAKKEERPADETVLTANMSGQVTLAGNSFDLLFNNGHLREISGRAAGLRLQIRNRSYFQPAEGRLDYRNESAFALDTDSDYGLRSLQVCKNNSVSGRILTDFFFNRESGNCFIICTVEYPEFNEDEIILASAPLELKLLFSGSAIVNSDRLSEPREFKRPEAGTVIDGSSFEINTGGRALRLSYTHRYDSTDFSELNGLSVSCIKKHRKSFLLVNPGGSYIPAPAGFYSNVRETFCIRLDLVSEK